VAFACGLRIGVALLRLGDKRGLTTVCRIDDQRCLMLRLASLEPVRQCGGGDVADPTAPALRVSALAESKSASASSSVCFACFTRAWNSSSVRTLR
jgi:hypothetical protein